MAICPICKSNAEEIESGFMDGKTFRCAKHGEFQVSDSVLSVPALMDEEYEPMGGRIKTCCLASRPRSAPTNPLI
jgi:hypothetical protein